MYMHIAIRQSGNYAGNPDSFAFTCVKFNPSANEREKLQANELNC